MAEFVVPFKEALDRLSATTEWLKEKAHDDPNALGGAANDYLRLFALTAFAWMWVQMANKALSRRNGSDHFYETKLQVARYFMTRVLPGTISLEAVVKSGAAELMAVAEDSF